MGTVSGASRVFKIGQATLVDDVGITPMSYERYQNRVFWFPYVDRETVYNWTHVSGDSFVTVAWPSHGFSTGHAITVYTSTATAILPEDLNQITVINGNTFTLEANDVGGNFAGTSKFTPEWNDHYEWIDYDEFLLYRVSIPGLGDLNAKVAIKEPSVTEIGTVIAFSGGGGQTWWTDAGEGEGELAVTVANEFAIDTELRAKGYRTINVQWTTYGLTDRDYPSWAAGQELAKPAQCNVAILAARPATLIRELHRQYCLGGVDNLVIMGNSAGASQTGYFLSHYGGQDIVKKWIPSAGPPHGAMAKMCDRGYPDYNGKESGQANHFDMIDQTYGYDQHANGPCYLGADDWDLNPDGTGNSTLWQRRWARDSISTAGRDLYYPNTVVHFVFGSEDETGADFSGRDVASAMRQAGQSLTIETLIGVGHALIDAEEGKAAIYDAIHGRPHIAQSYQKSFGSSHGKTVIFGDGQDFEINAGSLLVCALFVSGSSSGVLGEVNIPGGWTVDFSVSFNSDLCAILVLSKRAIEGDTGITLDFDSSLACSVELFEVIHLSNPILDQTSSDTASLGIGGTISIPATAETTADKEWALTVLGTSVASTASAWTDSFSDTSSIEGKLHVAIRSLEATETLEPEVTVDVATEAAAAVLSYRSA